MPYSHIPVKVKLLRPDARAPSYGRPGDAGLDIYACEDTILPPNMQTMVPTGVALAIPEGTVGLVWDRSGMAAKSGIKTMAGVLDSTYRGELKIVLINLRSTPYEVKKGDRIAQLLVQPIHTADIEVVQDLDETHRGEGGFGSSGR
jgi:dUTP pyrophosphatase